MKRRRLSTKDRVAFFTARLGVCEGCGWKIQPGKGWQIDHAIALELGGDDEAHNWQLLCEPCHRAKTSEKDVPAIAKAKRREAAHIGAKKSRNPLPGGRGSPFKKKLDGTVVRRVR